LDLLALSYTFTPRYTQCRQYSAIADLHHLPTTVAHALVLPVFTSRLLATALNIGLITLWVFKYYTKITSIHRRLSGTLLVWNWTIPKPNQVKVTLRLTVSQSVAHDQILLLFDSYGLVFLGRPLWRGDGSVFLYAADPRQRSLSRVRVPWHSWPYFTVPDLRLPFSLPPPTLRVTVEIFDPASTRVYFEQKQKLTAGNQPAAESRYITFAPTPQKTQLYCWLAPTAQKTSHVVPIVACRLTASKMCLPLRCVATIAARTT
jgi:hypothetical protein